MYWTYLGDDLAIVKLKVEYLRPFAALPAKVTDEELSSRHAEVKDALDVLRKTLGTVSIPMTAPHANARSALVAGPTTGQGTETI